MKLDNEIHKLKKSANSVRIKLFFSICLVIIAIILLLVLINNVVLEKYYLYNKTRAMKQVYKQINTMYNNNTPDEMIEDSINKLSIKNNIDVLIKSGDDVVLLTTDNYRVDYNKDINFIENMKQSNEKIKQ